MVLLEELLTNMPPVTRIVVGSSALLAVLCSLEVLTPLSLYLNWDLVFYEKQWWRPFTCFFFFGEFSFHFVWNTYIYLQYCSSLEEVGFRGRSADFVWMLVSTGILLLLLTATLQLSAIFLSSALMDVMIYLWSKKNPHVMVQVIFVTMRAAYLPFMLTFLSVLLGGTVTDHLLGIAVGHVFYFFTEIYPLMPTSGGFRLFRTPSVLKTIMGQAHQD
jgi:Derlin-2/3